MAMICAFKILYKDEYKQFFDFKNEMEYSCDHIKEFLSLSKSEDIKFCPVCGKKYSVKNKITSEPKKGVKTTWRCPSPDNAVAFINCEGKWNEKELYENDGDTPRGNVVMIINVDKKYICCVVNGNCNSMYYRLDINGISIGSSDNVYEFPKNLDFPSLDKDREFLKESLEKYGLQSSNIMTGIIKFDESEYVRYYYC